MRGDRAIAVGGGCYTSMGGYRATSTTAILWEEVRSTPARLSLALRARGRGGFCFAGWIRYCLVAHGARAGIAAGTGEPGILHRLLV